MNTQGAFEDEENYYHLQDRHCALRLVLLDNTISSLSIGIEALKRGDSPGEFAGDCL